VGPGLRRSTRSDVSHDSFPVSAIKLESREKSDVLLARPATLARLLSAGLKNFLLANRLITQVSLHDVVRNDEILGHHIDIRLGPHVRCIIFDFLNLLVFLFLGNRWARTVDESTRHRLILF
jgi:hypothetical protein